jgi:predicted outer membrane repeat protein
VDIADTTAGLILDTTNSPAGVTIDGGKRRITRTNAGSLITVGNGVTLTLRNITLEGHSDALYPALTANGSARVIYESGASVIDGGIAFSGLMTKPDSAIDEIKKAKTDGHAAVNVTLSKGTEVVSLDGNSDLGTGLSLTTGISPVTVNINGQGRTVRLDANSPNGSLITVGSGITLNLTNITLEGKSGNTASLITVNSGGHLNLGTGALITGNTTSGNGGGVLNSGTLTISGGAVRNNTAASGGGVSNSGTLTISGGEISNNTATGSGGGVNNSGTLTISGGKVSNNTAAANGGGVNNGSSSVTSFTISGGEVSGNTAAGKGGGVYTNYLTLNGTGKINGNHAATAGGVYLYSSGRFNHSAGEVSNNTATGNAGGVYTDTTVGGPALYTRSGTGVVSGKTAGGSGGGVTVGGGFNKTGGTLYGKYKADGTIPEDDALKNTASADGKGHALLWAARHRDRTAETGDNINWDIITAFD